MKNTKKKAEIVDNMLKLVFGGDREISEGMIYLNAQSQTTIKKVIAWQDYIDETGDFDYQSLKQKAQELLS